MRKKSWLLNQSTANVLLRNHRTYCTALPMNWQNEASLISTRICDPVHKLQSVENCAVQLWFCCDMQIHSGWDFPRKIEFLVVTLSHEIGGQQKAILHLFIQRNVIWKSRPNIEFIHEQLRSAHQKRQEHIKYLHRGQNPSVTTEFYLQKTSHHFLADHQQKKKRKGTKTLII